MYSHSKVSVVIPVYNASENLADTLAALVSQDYPGEVEIIAVDNNSTDGSNQIVANTPGVTLLYQKEIQNAAATRNKGIITATGQVIAFIDSDCIPATDWLRQGITTMQIKNVDQIAGRIEIKTIFPTSPVPVFIDALSNFNQEGMVAKHQAAMTGNLIVKRKVFDKAGLFNPNFFEFEDLDFGKRTATKGLTISYEPKCIVTHPVRTTKKQIWQRSLRSGRGVFILCQANPRWSGKWGWKHPLRSIKILLIPKSINWSLLPFPYRRITFSKRISIYINFYLLTNVPEALGYFKSWIQHTLN